MTGVAVMFSIIKIGVDDVVCCVEIHSIVRMIAPRASQRSRGGES
jgi:hypothetical protein